jgi:hypothetical protein
MLADDSDARPGEATFGASGLGQGTDLGENGRVVRRRIGVEILSAVQLQGVPGQVDAAQRIQPQPPARRRLRHGPEQQRRPARLRQPGNHGAVREGRLKNKQQIRFGGRQLLRRRRRARQIHHQIGRAFQGKTRLRQQAAGGCGDLAGQGNVKRRTP